MLVRLFLVMAGVILINMKYISFISIALLILVSYSYIGYRATNKAQQEQYDQRVNTLLNQRDSLRGLQIALNEQIEINLTTIQDKQQLIDDERAVKTKIIKYYDNRIKNITADLAIEIIPKDTIELGVLLLEGRRDKELLRSANAEIKLLETRSLVQGRVINDQKELISNLLLQVTKTEQAQAIQQESFKKQLKRAKRQRNFAILGGCAVVVIALF